MNRLISLGFILTAVAAPLHADGSRPYSLRPSPPIVGVTDSLNMRLVGSWPFGSCYAVASDTARELCYVCFGAAILTIDMSNPSTPVPLGDTINSPAVVADLDYDAANHYLYAALGEDGLAVWDMSDPALPVMVGSAPPNGPANDIIVRGNLVYVASGEAGLSVYDISDPAHPRLVGARSLGGYSRVIAVAGQYAYAPLDDAGILRILDIADPSAPVIVGTYEDPDDIFGAVAANAWFCYLYSYQDNGIQVLNVALPSDPRLIGRLEDICEIAMEMVVDGWRLYIGAQELYVVDVSNPAQPLLLGSSDAGANRLALHDQYVLACAGVTGLNVIGIDGAWPPHRVGHWRTIELNDARAAGEVCVLASEGELSTVDISNPAVPRELGFLPMPGECPVIAVRDSLVFAAGAYGLFGVFSIADPEEITEIGTAALQGSATDICVRGDHVYVASDNTGLLVYNVSIPELPGRTARVRYTGDCSRVTVDSLYAYVLVDSTLHILGLSDPAHPEPLGSWTAPDRLRGVAVREPGRTVVVGERQGSMCTVNVTDPRNPVPRRRLRLPEDVIDLDAAGSMAYALSGDGTVQVVNMADPGDPRYICGLPTSDEGPLRLRADGHCLFSVDDYEGVVIFEVPSSGNLGLVGNLPGNGLACDVALLGDLALVTTRSQGLLVLDVADPTRQRKVSSLALPGTAYAVEARDSLGYVAAGSAGLLIVDLSDPQQPALLGSHNTPDKALDVALRDSFAYVADEDAGLRIINVADPLQPFEAGGYDTRRDAIGVALRGDYAFVPTEKYGLVVFDVSDPTAPDSVACLPVNDKALGVAVYDHYALVADEDDGLLVGDIADPLRPVGVTSVWTPGDARGVTVNGHHVFVAEEGAGVWVYDITAPAEPRVVANYNTPGQAYATAVRGDLVYVADYSGGFHVLELLPIGLAEEAGDALPAVVLAGSPQARGNLSFSVSLSRTGNVSGTLFNSAGRRTGRIERGLPPGRHGLKLPTADLPAGTYFLRVSVGEHTSTHKVLLVN